MTAGLSTNNVWTEGLVAQLTDLWTQLPVISTIAIANIFGITKNAVVGKAHRLHLPGRPSPIKPLADPPSRRTLERRQQRKGQAAPLGSSRPQVVIVVAKAAEPEGVRDSEVRPSPATKVVMAQADGPVHRASPPAYLCCWPMWGFRAKPTHEYCCEATEAGRRYCPTHHARGTVKIPVPSVAALATGPAFGPATA